MDILTAGAIFPRPAPTGNSRHFAGSEGLIPDDRPVSTNDMLDLKEKLGLSDGEFCGLLAIAPAVWWTMRRYPDDLEKPLLDPLMAILVRWYDRHPEDCPIKPAPTPADIALQVRDAGIGISNRMFGLLLGREESAGDRWLSRGASVPAMVARVLRTLDSAFRERGRGVRRTWVEWAELAETEARARGIDGGLRGSRGWNRRRLTQERMAEEKDTSPTRARRKSTAKNVPP
jgi:hypothetical protein